ncbi:MAG: DUF4244 domain-containing protein [Propionibacteriaceae bacterium]|jgi:hypothetical protein|nr:DUF4244 domain-containing protein [Propionibacteriaceae bacterium]
MKNLIVKARPAFAASRLGRFCKALRSRGDAGMTTAEYAIGILVIIAFGGVMFKIITDGSFRSLVFKLIEFFFTNIMKVI